jgi:hypothetical protein
MGNAEVAAFGQEAVSDAVAMMTMAAAATPAMTSQD